MVENDGVDGGGGGSGKSDKKSSEIEKSSKSPKSLKGLKNLQRPSVWRNVYRSTGPPSTKKKLELPLKLFLTVFRALFCWAQELSQYQIWSDYRQGKADALLRFFP